MVALAAAIAAVAVLAAGARIAATRLPGELRPYARSTRGEPLFHTADGFYHLRLSRDLAETGRRGDREVDGRRWDDLSFAPSGRPVVPSLLQPIQTWAWRLWPGDASLATIAYYLPAIGSALLAAAALWIGRRLAGTAAGLASGVMAALHPELISHTHAGMADTPWLALVLYATATGCALELAATIAGPAGGAGTSEPGPVRIRAALGWLGALAVTLALFAITWVGWLAAAATAAVPIVAAVLGRLWRQERSARRRAGLLLGTAAAALASALLILGSPAWRKLVRYAEPGTLGGFPDGASQVQELIGLAPARLFAQLGGWPVVMPAALGILWLALGAPGLRPRPPLARLGVLLLAAWALPAAVAGALAMRFLVFGMPAVAIAAGCGVAALATAAGGAPGRRLRPPTLRAAVRAALVAVLLAAVAWTFRPRFESFALRPPAADLALAEAAAAIADRAPGDALVYSWWDHGYSLSALSGRPAVIDGGSYQTRRLYWLALALTTRDETLAANLLRMIGCGGDQRLFRTLRANRTPADRSVALIRLALRHDDPELAARTLLRNGGGQGAVAELFRVFECRPPPSWLVVGGDLAAKTTSWAHFGSWRFDVPNPPARPGISVPVSCALTGGRAECTNGWRADLERDGFADRSTPGHFAAIGPARADGLVPILHQHGPGLLLTFVRRDLADSLYVRLWYFDGLDLERFHLAGTYHHPPYTDRVQLYAIDWGG